MPQTPQRRPQRTPPIPLCTHPPHREPHFPHHPTAPTSPCARSAPHHIPTPPLLLPPCVPSRSPPCSHLPGWPRSRPAALPPLPPAAARHRARPDATAFPAPRSQSEPPGSDYRVTTATAQARPAPLSSVARRPLAGSGRTPPSRVKARGIMGNVGTARGPRLVKREGWRHKMAAG